MRAIFSLGPLKTAEGSRYLCVAWSLEEGTQMGAGPDALAALQNLLAKGVGSGAVCEPSLEAEARQVGVPTGPLSAEAVELKAGLAVTVDHAGLLGTGATGPVVVELIRAAAQLKEAAPWSALPEGQPLEVTVAGSPGRSYGALLVAEEGVEHGVALVASPTRSLGLFVHDQPAFVADAVEAFTGVRLVPHLIHVERGKTVPATGEDLAVLVAATRAIVDLARDGAPGRGECWTPRKTEVTAKLRQAPAPGQLPKVGRNDPCPCGSGKKYKRCHGGGAAPSD